MTTPLQQDYTALAPSILHVSEEDALRVVSFYERFVKPAVDVVGALLLILLFAPVLLAVAIGVRVTLGKGILYRQERIGQDGVPFTMYKFRSMRHDRRAPRTGDAALRRPEATTTAALEEDRRRTHKHPQDPRVDGFGRFIRDFSLDELPQLFNVLKGDLSLVGPRPELVEIVGRYESWEHRRHVVRPGLTGLWQVTDRDDSGLMHLCVERDLEYVDGLSFLMDLRILALTPAAILFGAQSGAETLRVAS